MEKIKSKLVKFCVYRERCHKEVRSKLLSEKVYGDDLEEIIFFLINEDFLNEERYARSYARGKFRNNKWGIQKIRLNLKQKNISDYCLRKAMEEIDKEEYEETAKELIEKKLKDDFSFLHKNKVYKYMLGRGYEPHLIKNVLDEFHP